MLAEALRPELADQVAAAADSLAHGEPVLIFDAADREGETDLVFLSERATPELVRLARVDAGASSAPPCRTRSAAVWAFRSMPSSCRRRKRRTPSSRPF